MNGTISFTHVCSFFQFLEVVRVMDGIFRLVEHVNHWRKQAYNLPGVVELDKVRHRLHIVVVDFVVLHDSINKISTTSG